MDLQSSTIRAVAFDLGGTLVQYYTLSQFPAILDEALSGLHEALSGIATVSLADARRAAEREGHEQRSGQVSPLMQRLARVFGLTGPMDPRIEERCCREFLRPIFRRARVYDDTHETLLRLRASGFRVAVVSNTPWGSPCELWREELARLGLADKVDSSVFCTDVGWRKPAAPIFEFALQSLGVEAAECLFVGDHPEWDCQGAERNGLVPVLLDRDGEHPSYAGSRIRTLGELWSCHALDTATRHA